MHLNGALTMANVVQFLLGDIVYIGEDSRKIIVGHMLEGELPKLFVFIGIVFGVVSRVFVTSAVTKPNIITFVCKQKCWSFIFVINDPSV